MDKKLTKKQAYAQWDELVNKGKGEVLIVRDDTNHSRNYDSREGNPIKYIILHYTEVDFKTAYEILIGNTDRKVSAHYLVDLSGDIIRLVPDEYRAWHAGESKWNGQEKLNDTSIGIEIVNDGKTPYPEEQIREVVNMVGFLQEKYKIEGYNIIGHSDVAPKRKIDPGEHFPWERFKHIKEKTFL